MNSVTEKWNEIIEDLEHNAIRVYQQRNMLKVYDLVYHTVRSFAFNGKTVERGWGDALVIGSPRCGKSEGVKQYINFTQAGEMITGENVSYAGLVGGVKITDSSQMILWGKYARNDGKLVACDELSNLSVDDIGRLSALRSSGVAEVVKIQSNKAYARTRKLFISNPRDGSDLSGTDFGILAVKGLIGRSEDIARFDLVVGVTPDGITPEAIAREQQKKVPHRFTAKLCHERIMWAWSRTPGQVRFSEAAVKAIYDLANRHVKDWSSTIPMVVGPEQPERIARLCAGLAARVFSTDQSGELLLVKQCHVEAIDEFMDGLFRDPGLRYDMFVQKENRKGSQFGGLADLAELVRTKLPDHRNVLRVVSDARYFEPNTLGAEVYTLTPDQVKKAISVLVHLNLIARRKGGYMKTDNFNRMMREQFPDLILGAGLDDMPDDSPKEVTGF